MDTRPEVEVKIVIVDADRYRNEELRLAKLLNEGWNIIYQALNSLLIDRPARPFQQGGQAAPPVDRHPQRQRGCDKSCCAANPARHRSFSPGNPFAASSLPPVSAPHPIQ